MTFETSNRLAQILAKHAKLADDNKRRLDLISTGQLSCAMGPALGREEYLSTVIPSLKKLFEYDDEEQLSKALDIVEKQIM